MRQRLGSRYRRKLRLIEPETESLYPKRVYYRKGDELGYHRRILYSFERRAILVFFIS